MVYHYDELDEHYDVVVDKLYAQNYNIQFSP